MLAVAALAGCDAGNKDFEPLDLPPVHVTAVLGATELKNGSLDYHVIFNPSDPTAAALPVLSTTAFKFQFDRVLLPSSVFRQSVCAQPMAIDVVNATTCAGITFRPSYDPVRREITYRQDPGSALDPADYYELTLYSTTMATDPGGILSFDGVPLEVPARVPVTVAANPPGVKLPPDLPPNDDPYCKPPDPSCTGLDCARSVQDILSGCAYGGCHASSPADAGAALQAAEGLQLGSPDLLWATAINHIAHETQTGEDGFETTNTGEGLRFGRAMPILSYDTSTKGVPATSYLIYKLLVFPGLKLEVPFLADPTDKTAPPPEVVRLRNELVVGMPMPPMNAGPTIFLREHELEWIGQWVTQGMPMSCQ